MWARSLASLALVVAACGSGASSTNPCGDGPPCALDCGPGVDYPMFEGAAHVAEPSMVTYSNNPPASGSHWPAWQRPWGPYPGGLPRERWVHNLEHGGIVLAYNCPGGCDETIGELTAIYNATPVDRFGEQRILIVPDAQMPHTVAALAWRWRWQGDAVDMATIRCFISARYDRAPESTP